MTMDTSSALSGTNAQLAFDFIDGDYVVNNTVSISGFSTDGVLGASSTVGGVSGNLPANVTINDDDFFNELLQPITLANSISFSLNITENHAGGPTPDSFSLFLLDNAAEFSLFPTTDPFGADALLAVEIIATGDLSLQVFMPKPDGANDPVGSVVNAVFIPEPSVFLLLIAGLAGLGTRRTPKTMVVKNIEG